MLKKIVAFTLSEIIIAMSVIGVVASLVVPAMTQRKMKVEYSAKLKNFYTRMQTAIADMVEDRGGLLNYQSLTYNPADKEGPYNWYIENIDPYMGHKTVDPSKYMIYFEDGSSLKASCVGSCNDYDYDVNGDKGPNKRGVDRYKFVFCLSPADREKHFGDKNELFAPYAAALATATREYLYNSCALNGEMCAALLFFDDWEFKDDYPVKF